MPVLAFCQPYLTTSLPISVTPQEAAVLSSSVLVLLLHNVVGSLPSYQ